MSQPDRNARSYRHVSTLIGVGIVAAYAASIYFFAAWRYGRKVAHACGKLGDYSQSAHCLEVREGLGLVAALIEAVPFSSVTMLALLGTIYLLFGKQLDLRSIASGRRAALLIFISAIAGIATLLLLTMGAAYLYTN